MQLHNGLVEVNVSMKAARLGRGQVQTPIPGDLGHPLQADCGLTLRVREWVLSEKNCLCALADPVGDGLGRDVELARHFGRSAPGTHQLDHLLPEFRRARWSDFGHLRILEHKEWCVHGTGSTPVKSLLHKLAILA